MYLEQQNRRAAVANLDWRQVHQEATIVDLHVHPSLHQQLFRRNVSARSIIRRTFHGSPFNVRASFPRLRNGGFDVILSAVYIPEKGIRRDFPIINLFRLLRPDLWARVIGARPQDAALRALDDIEKGVSESSGRGAARMAFSYADLAAILKQPQVVRPIAVVHAVEGGHSLGEAGNTQQEILHNLDVLHQRGVAYLTLAHFYPNQVVNPCFPFPEDLVPLSARPTMWRDLTLGLTETGRKVVERMIELGMVIDISHCTPVARRDIYDIVDASGRRVPLLASHVGAYAINPSPYNLTDWEIQRIARDGGVIGIIFMPYWLMPRESRQGLNFISRHIDHVMQVGGEDVAGIGTDFDGFTTPPDDLDNASQLPRLTQRLVVDGHSATVIQKILGGNAMRMLGETWCSPMPPVFTA
jgi:microsomal dipeptidase-like Zn-dependent dipeptidase